MSIRVELELDDGRFTSRVLHAGESLRQFNRNVGQGYTQIRQLAEGSRGFLSTLRDITAVLGLASAALHNVQAVTTGWVGEIVKVNAEMERMTLLMKGMSTAADPLKDAAQQVKFIRDFAKEAPFSMQALADSFVKLKATGIDPTKGAMKSMTDAVAAFGGSDETLKRGILAISQMSGKGVIQMEELRQQFGEAVPRAVELMARSMGVSMAQLIKEISTGTVQAKPALQLLFMEMDRTFGGAAQEQMKTFTGMVAVMKTRLQDLAIRVGDTGFFETIKKQLGDFNTFLGGQAAARLSDMLGRGLNTVVLALRETVNWAIRLSDELILIGKYFAAAFAFNAGVAALGSMGAMIGGVATQVRLLGAAFTGMQLSAQMTSLGVAIGQLGIAGAGITRTTGAVRTLAATLPLVAAGFGLLTSVALPLGLAIAAVALTFGVFSDKAKEAWENLEKYGATSRKVVADASELVKIKEKELATLEKQRNAYALLPQSQRPKGQEALAAVDRNIAQKQKELADMRVQLSKFADQADKAEGEANARTRMEQLDDGLRVLQRNYDERGRLAAEAQDKEIKALVAAKRSTDASEAAFKEQSKARAIELYDEKLRLLNLAYEAEQELMVRGNEQQKKDSQFVLDSMIARMKVIRDQKEIAEATSIGIPKSPKQENEAKLLERAQQALEKMQASIAGNRAELAGASNEAAKLAYELEHGKYGPADNPQIARVIQQLKEAQAENEKLQEAIDGRTKFERDLENLKIKAAQRLFEAQTKGQNDLDKFVTAYQQGFYKGFGQTPAERAATGVKAALDQARDAANRAAEAFRGNTFGGQTMSAIDSFIGKLREVATIFGLIRGDAQQTGSTIGSFTFSRTNVSAGANAGAAMGGSTDPVNTSLSPRARAFLNAIASVESGGRYDVRYTPQGGATFTGDEHPRIYEKIPGKNDVSSAAGRYQFTASTWDAMGGGKFTPENQDAKAWQLAQQRYKQATGRDLDSDLQQFGMTSAMTESLASTWEGFQKSGAKAIAAYQRSIGTGEGPAYTPRFENDSRANIDSLPTEDARRKATEVARTIQQALQLESDNDLADKVKEITRAIQEAGEKADGTEKRVAAMKKKIREGEFGPDKDPESARYTKLLELVAQLDKAEELAATRKKLRGQIDNDARNRERDAEVIAEREAELKRRMDGEGRFKFSDGYYREFRRITGENMRGERAQQAGVISQTELDALLAANAETLRRYRDLEVGESIQGEQKKIRDIERGLMTANDAREAAHQEEIRRLQELLGLTSTTAEQRAQIEAIISKKISLHRRQLAAESPMGRQMKEWADFGNNMEKAMTGWMDSAIDGLATLVTTGKADFKSLIDSILRDIARIALRGLVAQMSGKGGGSTGKMGGAKTGGRKIGAPLMLGVPTAHTGGVAGALTSATRSISALAFANAPRFHKGGFPGLAADEVPIIARKGEGVFTEEQMAAMGGAYLNAPMTNHIEVNVQGSGGSPAQNEDLAARIGEQVERSMRSFVDGRVMALMRPGAMLNAGKR